MKKICISFNHLQYSDGVARSVISMANHLASLPNVEVTLRPIFRVEKSMLAHLLPNIKVKPVFKFYVAGLGRAVLSLPKKVLHRLCFGKGNDINIAFQYGVSTKALAGSTAKFLSKQICWMHTYDEDMIQKKYYLAMDKMVCVSKEGAERLKQDLNNQVPVDYCYNLLDEQVIFEQAKQGVNIEKDSIPTFISVGRLSREKGYSRLIDICKQLLDEGFIFQLKIIGNGPEFPSLKENIEKNGLKEQIILCGEQSNPYQFVVNTDLFICSSFAEGYSTACTESVILGIPVLTTRVGGAQEIIETSRAGLLVENDTSSLYEGLKFVLENPMILEQWKKTLNMSREAFYLSWRARRLEEVLELKK